MSKKIRMFRKKNADTLIVGLSYSLCGIEESLLDSALNLSLPSQDIFYSYLLTKKIIEINKIKKVAIGLSYYSFYFDMSKSIYNKFRIDNVYYPLLKHSHNYKNERSTKKKIFRFAKKMIYNKSYMLFMSLVASDKYFNLRNTREKACGIYEFSKLIYNDFNKLCNEEKLEIGEKRADMHNKLLKYENTRIENEGIFKEFINMLIGKNIEPIIVIFPVTKYYKYTLKDEFKDTFYQYINELNLYNKIKIVDLYNSKGFNDNDFIDSDHLSKAGAIKVTHILSGMQGGLRSAKASQGE
ncbi:MAG TPA: hypothetical protein VIK86_06295 [Candidatus Paceibacterota bacterium]